ncbi:hypothetical protein CAMGR0001_1051 [Campylobacter gracilis RM3268]|uniref:Uncharacterized protein n=1 Tax=Campylobacter gracilis RM3268 TaxID=553220 RepID=C8PGQ6_9BACT|nr:hypothetical protein CAMGR0001_1051 [Campylobacter gracilis RM3268]
MRRGISSVNLIGEIPQSRILIDKIDRAEFRRCRISSS